MIFEEDGRRVFARDGFGVLGKWYLLPFSISVLIIAYLAGFACWVGWSEWGPLGNRWPPPDMLHWGGFVVAGIGSFYLMFHLTESVWRIFSGDLRIALDENEMILSGLCAGNRSIHYTDILTIRPFRSIRGEKAFVLIDRRGAVIKPVMDEAGELIEELLPRLNNLQEVYMPEEYLKPRYWGKEPDWDIINAAIARAEENREEKEQEQQS